MSERRKVLDLFEKEATWVEERVTRGIEEHRKGEATVTVVDEKGNAIPHAEVRVRQTSHTFRFGANLFMLDGMELPEKNEKYKTYFADVFNMATLPFYWNALEPERGKTRYAKDSPRIYRRPAPDLCIEFCEQHGIEPREHGLAYEHSFPAWLYEASVEEVKREFERRCAEIAERYADKIPTIEVTNEMVWKKGRTSFYDAPDFIEWCFKTAEKYFPNNILASNEGTALPWGDNCRTRDRYYAYLEAAMLKGARIDAIGMQYHHFHKREKEYEATRTLLDPKSLYAHMDLYAGLGKPLQITEITVPAYSWEAEDEEIQAEILRRLYSVWFSHPSVEQIVYWNLVDGYAHLWNVDEETLRASLGNMTVGENYYHGGLLRFDLSPKPAYDAIKDLIQRVWHTDETLVTDETGRATFRGFFGDYELTVGASRVKRATLAKNGDNRFEIVI